MNSDDELVLEDDEDVVVNVDARTVQSSERRVSTVDTSASANPLHVVDGRIDEVTEQFMMLSSTETVDKAIALEIMNLHHEMVTHYRRMEYEKNREIAALQSQLEFLRIGSQKTKDLDELKRQVATVEGAVHNMQTSIQECLDDVQTLSLRLPTKKK